MTHWTLCSDVVYYHCSEFQIFRPLNGSHFLVLSLYTHSVQNRAWFCLHFSDHRKPKQTDVIFSRFVSLSLVNNGRLPRKNWPIAGFSPLFDCITFSIVAASLLILCNILKLSRDQKTLQSLLYELSHFKKRQILSSHQKTVNVVQMVKGRHSSFHKILLSLLSSISWNSCIQYSSVSVISYSYNLGDFVKDFYELSMIWSVMNSN